MEKVPKYLHTYSQKNPVPSLIFTQIQSHNTFTGFVRTSCINWEIFIGPLKLIFALSSCSKVATLEKALENILAPTEIIFKGSLQVKEKKIFIVTAMKKCKNWMIIINEIIFFLYKNIWQIWIWLGFTDAFKLEKSLKIFLLQKVKTSQLRSNLFQVIILNQETYSKSQSISQLRGLFHILKP